MSQKTIFKIISPIMILSMVFSTVIFVFPQQAKAEDLGLENYRNQSQQNPKSNQIVGMSGIDQQMGAATASVSIVVSPGRLGIEPKISLQYNSQNKNGILGIGWGLELGKIYRSTKYGLPNYNDSDLFISDSIGAGELTKISSNEWREKIERSFSKFIFSSNTWVIYDTSGTKYYFGSSAASRQQGSGGTFAWFLDRAEDVHGNYMTISYLTDQNTLYPNEILYTSNSQTGLPASAKVNFIYEIRPDAVSNYNSGVNQVMAKRLKEIKIYFNNQLVRKYVLAYYPTSAEFPFSRLQTVTQYGSDGTSSLPSATFNYQQNSASFTNNTSWANSLPAIFSYEQSGKVIDQGWRLADVNRDGLVDAIQSTANYNLYGYSMQQDSYTKQVYINTGNGWAYSSAWTNNMPNIFFIIHTRSYFTNGSGMIGEWYEDTGARFVDINRDGLNDIVQSRYFKHQKYNGDLLLDGTEKSVYLNIGTGWQFNQAWTNSLPEVNIWQIYKHEWNSYWGWRATSGFNEDVGTRFIDLNSDGLLDLLRADNYTNDYPGTNPLKIAYINNGSGWTLNSMWSSIPEFIVSRQVTHSSAPPYDESRKFRDLGIRLADVNGDGLVDIVKAYNYRNHPTWCNCYSTDELQRAVYLNTGAGWTANISSWANTIPFAFVDDTNFNCQPYTSLHWNEDTSSRLLDVNGDGLVDFLYARNYNGTTQKGVLLNNGQGWVSSTSWTNALPMNFIDETFSCTTGPVNYWRNNKDLGLRTEDVNGDGLIDILRSRYTYSYGNEKNAYLNSGGLSTMPNLMTSVNNGIGGVVEFSYTPSTQYNNVSSYENSPSLAQLGMTIDVVSQHREKDRGVNQYNYNYNYWYGVYDYTDREFRGFHPVSTIYPDNSHVENYYLQDDIKKGIQYYQHVYNTNGVRLSQTAYHPTVRTDTYGSATVSYPYYDRIDEYLFNADATVYRVKRNNFTYDAYGNLNSRIEHGEYDTANNTEIYGDERTTNYQYVYNTTKWILNKLARTEILNKDNQKDSETFFYYDNSANYTDPPIKGDLTKKEYWLDQNGANVVETFTYDIYGHQLKKINANSMTTTTYYNDNIQIYPTAVKNAKGQFEYFSYNPSFGVITLQTDVNNNATSYSYDVFGRLIKMVRPYDSISYPTEEYQYDLSSQPIKTTKVQRIRPGTPPSVLTIVSFYDGFNRLIETKKMSESNQSIVMSYQTYDSRGNVKDSYLPYFSSSALSSFVMPATQPKVTNTYDTINRLTRTDYPDGTNERINYNSWTNTTSDRNGHDKIVTNDAYNQVVTVQEKDGQLTYTTQYTYDSLGNLQGIKDQANNITTMTYDSLGRKLSMSDPDMGTWFYQYDPVGSLISQTDAKNQTISFTYDQLNRVLTKNYPDNTKVIYEYDNQNVANSKGKLTKVTDTSGITSFTYDQRGRETSITKNIDSTNYAVSNAYDAMDRQVSITYPDGEVVSYVYNNQGNIDSVAGVNTYVSNVNYNAADQQIDVFYGNGGHTAYAYDANNLRLTHFETTTGNQFVQYLNYTYDGVGNVTAINDTQHTATQSFAYDDLNRLVYAAGSYGAKQYQYNPIGNIMVKEGINYTYGSGKPHAVTSTSGGFSATYDSNGNMITRSNANLTYDYDNRVVEYANTNNPYFTTFSYDWQGNRVKKIYTNQYNNPLIKTIYIGNLWEKEDTTIRKHYYLGNQKVATRTNGSSLMFFHNDHLQSTNITTGANGQVLGITEYLPFGSTTTDTNTSTDYKYNGKELDTETGLYYYGARYYDPVLGRFITTDSIIPSIGNPQNLNRYTYTLNNPIRYIDPNGHTVRQAFNDMMSQFTRIPGTVAIGFGSGYVGGLYYAKTFDAAGAIDVGYAGLQGGLTYWHTGNTSEAANAFGEALAPALIMKGIEGGTTYAQRSTIVVYKNGEGKVTQANWAERNGQGQYINGRSIPLGDNLPSNANQIKNDLIGQVRQGAEQIDMFSRSQEIAKTLSINKGESSSQQVTPTSSRVNWSPFNDAPNPFTSFNIPPVCDDSANAGINSSPSIAASSGSVGGSTTGSAGGGSSGVGSGLTTMTPAQRIQMMGQ